MTEQEKTIRASSEVAKSVSSACGNYGIEAVFACLVTCVIQLGRIKFGDKKEFLRVMSASYDIVTDDTQEMYN